MRARKVERQLRDVGAVFLRQTGSHHIWRLPDGSTYNVVNREGRDVKMRPRQLEKALEKFRKKNPIGPLFRHLKKGGGKKGFPWGMWEPQERGGRFIYEARFSFPANSNRGPISKDQEDEVLDLVGQVVFLVMGWYPTDEDVAVDDRGDHLFVISKGDGTVWVEFVGMPEEDVFKTNPLGPLFDHLKKPPPPPPRPTYTVPQKMQLRSMGRGHYLPAWNVKVYKRGVFDPDIVQKHFKCSRKKAEQATEWAWDTYQRMYWENAQQDAEYHLENLHPSVKVESDGRSGGWLVLEGLPEIDDRGADLLDVFDPDTVLALAEFEKDILGNIDGLLNDEKGMIETIDVNDWTS